MALTFEEVLEILRAIDSSTCQEFVLELGDTRIVVRKRGAGSPVSIPAGDEALAERTMDVPAAPRGGEDVPATSSRPTGGNGAMEHRALPDGLVAVRAPMIGRFYRAPGPQAPPFVEVGSFIEAEQTVCIIEVMKLMNQIPAGVRGRVVAIHAEDGHMVEYGQPLIVVNPN